VHQNQALGKSIFIITIFILPKMNVRLLLFLESSKLETCHHAQFQYPCNFQGSSKMEMCNIEQERRQNSGFLLLRRRETTNKKCGVVPSLSLQEKKFGLN